METLYSYNDKLNLKKDIKYLSKNEHIEILRLLSKNNIKYTENNNGIWFNLKSLDKKLVNSIYSFVQNCKNIKLELDSLNKLNIKNKQILEDKLNKKKNNVTSKNNEKDLDKKYADYELKSNIDNKYIVNAVKKDLKIKKYPNLTKRKNKLEGTKARVMKKCKEINSIVYNSKSKKKEEISNIEYISENEELSHI